MRNLKKVLTLVLTLAMLLSVMVVGAGAATFNDQDSIKNDEAVDMCVALSIIGGYEDGTFRPTGNVTRAEMCKMICVALNGGKEPTMGSGLIGTFNDVATSDWSAPYIEYCVSQGIVGGVGGGRFNPTGNITGTQAAKMLLCILGYNASIAGYVGNDYWETKINVDAAQKGLYDELGNIDASAALTRDQAAQMIWNALNAYEVEYVTTLVTGPNGELTSQVDVRDKVVGENKDKITLLEDKYEANINANPYTMTAYSWNDVKKQFTYTVNGVEYPTAADFTDLYGMNVKVIWSVDSKTGDKHVYGIVPWDSKVIASGALGDVEYEDTDSVKIDGTKYRTDNSVASLTAYPDNDYASGAAVFSGKNLASAQHVEYGFSAIDNDGDNKIDCFVTYPFSVAKVSYVGDTSFNLEENALTTATEAASGIKFENVNAYDGMAKDDYVKIIAAANTADNTTTYEKITDISEGKVTSTKSGSIMIDSTWYDYDSNNANHVYALDNSYKLVMVNGYICANETVQVGANISDYAVVTAASKASGVNGHQVKLLFSDGKTEVVAAAKNYSSSQDSVPSSENGGDMVGKLVTFKIKDGDYELALAETTHNQTNADKAGFDRILTPGAGGYAYNADGKSTLNSTRIADDAVIFVKDGSGKYKVMTGVDFKKYNTNTSAPGGTTPTVAYTNNGYANENKTTGFENVALAYVTLNTDVIVKTTNYGFVTSGLGTTKDADGNTVSTLTFWTADGKVDAVADANVSDSVVKGSVITFEKNSDGTYAIERASGVNVSAVTGWNGSDEVNLASGGFKNVKSDTVILNIDSETPAGLESKNIMIASKDALGNYNKNAYWVATGNDLDVIIIDTKNNLSVMPGKTALDNTTTTTADINTALASCTDVTVDGSGLTNVTAPVVVPDGSTLTITKVHTSNALSVTAESGSTVNVNGADYDTSMLVITAKPGSTVNYNNKTLVGGVFTSDGNITLTSQDNTDVKITAIGNVVLNESFADAGATQLVLTSGTTSFTPANARITVAFGAAGAANTVGALFFHDDDGAAPSGGTPGTPAAAAAAAVNNGSYAWTTYYTDTAGHTDTGWVKQP